ncbi:MAG: DUF4332 domain-containing protein [Chloroflexi bacterium]|nr:DUF4332 domain-containing protein [Chloroflexota bacterium]
MARLVDIEGIGEKYVNKLREVGVRSVEDLLKMGAAPAGRKELAAKSGVKPELILEWVNHADLFRIKGVGSEYADLLEASGVDTVKELAQRNSANLYKKMDEVNQKKKLVRRLPTEKQVGNWVAQAKSLKRMITY